MKLYNWNGTDLSLHNSCLYAQGYIAIVFTVELLLRLLVDGVWFWLGEGRTWNIIDTLVVVFAWLEIVVS